MTQTFIPPGPLGFGGAPLGNMYRPIDDDTAEAALVAAWNTGVRHFDTAPVYGRGISEHRFGHVLRSYPREHFVISTKVGRLLRADARPDDNALPTEGPSTGEAALFKEGLPFEVHVDYGYDAAMRSVEDSCQRLSLAQIDIVYVHDLGSDHLGDAWEHQFDLAMTGAFRALTELRDQGVIKAWGLANNVLPPLMRALERAEPDILQISGRYTLLDQTAHELLPTCAARGIPVVLGGPYNSGILAGGRHYNYKPADPGVIRRTTRITEICARHDVDIRAVALQFCTAHPAVMAVIPGAQTAEKTWQNAEFMDYAVPDELWQDLKDCGLIPLDVPTTTHPSSPVVR